MRILFVGMAHSVHTARWIAQLTGLGWDLHVFPVDEQPLHPELRDVTVHSLFGGPDSGRVRWAGLSWPFSRGKRPVRWLLGRLSYAWRDASARLARTIRVLRPDIVHVLHMQHAGYLLLNSLPHGWGKPFPVLLYSSWGSDIYYYGVRPEHHDRVRQFLALCDFHIADCHRDVSLAQRYGFRGRCAGVFPVGGGFDLARYQEMRAPGPPSARRVVLLKGYHQDDWAGRALVGLHAFTSCVDVLADYAVVVFSATENTRHAVDFVRRITGLRVSVLPQTSHDEIVRLMGRARVAIGLSVTDGSPSALLEAIAMGALPIQSDTGSTAEWIEQGQNGLLVPPEDPPAVAAALRRALDDDTLVDAAAVLNAQIASTRLADSVIRPQVIDVYRSIAATRARTSPAFASATRTT